MEIEGPKGWWSAGGRMARTDSEGGERALGRDAGIQVQPGDYARHPLPRYQAAVGCVLFIVSGLSSFSRVMLT